MRCNNAVVTVYVMNASLEAEDGHQAAWFLSILIILCIRHIEKCNRLCKVFHILLI
jgi:hypothetical protein